ncbi:MAG TPA: flagellar basal body P-ring formation chaperone FlgA [Hyphomicrobiaceae bacterium]|jgi:flagella basal body P-ring formation protein FlgA|nr:flagellar basal body P-ring formation chaperone FlgA [Hyphomicrobiaceae bacterium]
MRFSSRHRWAPWLAAILGGLAWVAGACLAAAEDLELPVPRAVIYPGDIIADEMLVGRAFIASTVARHTIFESREGLVGKVAKRTLLTGQPIPISYIRDPYLVNQGKAATVVFQHGGLTITANALALQNGGLGDVVSLRNLDSGTVIRGTVVADGSVRMDPP